MILGPQSVIEKLLADALDREGIPTNVNIESITS